MMRLCFSYVWVFLGGGNNKGVFFALKGGMNRTNILLQDWELPPFDRIRVEDYEAAVSTAIAEAERNVEAIATSEETPTFENTVEALESASQRLDRISAIMLNLNECCTSDELQATVMKLEPLMTRFSMKVMTDERIYRRVKAVSEYSDTAFTLR